MKTDIIRTLKGILAKKREIKFAYLFGSFTEEKNYQDIDIGIYIYPLPTNVFVIASGLKHKISRALMKKNINLIADDIDIVILNLVSFTFLNRIFKEGILIFDRDANFRTSVIERNSINYRECVGLLKESAIL